MTNTPIAADQVPGGGKILYHRNSDGTIVQAGADNPLPVNASVTATAQTVAKATAATPSYIEGDTAAPLSVDLSGNLRTLASVSASIAATANASDPSWIEASSHGLTTDLAGYLRSLCKQVGIWSMKIDQTTPGTTNGVAATNLPAAVSVNSGLKDNGTLRVVIATDQPQNTNAFKVDASATTQPVSATSLPLPTGAATAAKQPALGTAGTPSADVISVQGIASGVALAVSGTFWQATQPVSNAGTFAVQAAQSGTWNIGTITTITGITTAFGATGSAVPANAGYKGLLAKTALPAAGSDGNLVGAMADKFGRQIVRGALRELLTTAALNTIGTSGTLLAAQGAGVFADMYRLVIANSSAAAVLVTISDGTNSYGFEVPANSTVGFSGPAADATPAASANTAWTYTVAAGTTTIYIHAQFVLNK